MKKPNNTLNLGKKLLKKIIGKKQIDKVSLINNQDKKRNELKFDAIFIFCGFVPNVKFLTNAGIKMDKSGHVIVDENLMTSVPGIFAAGDITGKLKRIAWAIGEGALAAFSVYKWLKKPYWAK